MRLRIDEKMSTKMRNRMDENKANVTAQLAGTVGGLPEGATHTEEAECPKRDVFSGQRWFKGFQKRNTSRLTNVVSIQKSA